VFLIDTLRDDINLWNPCGGMSDTPHPPKMISFNAYQIKDARMFLENAGVKP
jgi:hypothetical protein